MDGTAVYVLLVIFIATLIRSLFGFGEALIAVPLLAFRIPVNIAAPVAVLISITVALVIVLQDWHHVELRSASWLVAATMAGIPLGLLLLTHGNQQLVKAGLGSLIVAFALFMLLYRRPPELHSDSRGWLLGCGFLAGILGGAYGMNGPPLAVYGSMRRWSAPQFRATLQGYFLPASVVGMAGYWVAGLWVHAVTRYFLYSLPAALLAIAFGRMLNRRMRGQSFLRYVQMALIAIGAALIVQALRS
jgi:hypothetical protein